MLEYKYVPEIEGVEGHVILKVPSAKERLVLVKSAGISGEDVGLDEVIKIMDLAEEYIKEVKIKKGDVECDSFESLSYFDFGMEVINKSSAILMGGIPTGKN